jgi:hypothetical protein
MPTLRTFASTRLWLTTLAAATAAPAEPFHLYAQYERRANADAKLPKELKVQVSTTDTVIADSPDYSFSGIFIAPKSDDLSKQTLSIIRNFVFMEGGRVLDVRPPGDALDAPKLLVGPNDLKAAAVVSQHPIEVRWKLKPDYLCRMELELREGQITGQQEPPSAKAIDVAERLLKPPRSSSEDEKSRRRFAATIFAQSFGKQTSPPSYTAYSFCPSLSSAVDWDKISHTAVNPEKKTPKAMEDDARSLLVKKLLPVLKDKGGLAGVSSDFDLRDAPDAQDRPSNVFIATKLHFAIVKRPDALFRFTESKMWCPNGEERCPIHDVVDQSSTIALEMNKIPGASEDTANVALIDRLNVFVSYKDGSGNPVKKKVSVGDDGTLAFSLGDELNQDIQMTAELPLTPIDGSDPAAMLVVRSDKVTVRSIGFSATVPLFSELFTIAKQNPVNLSDEQSQSSIPISWAYDFSKNRGKHVAITFPGMISINPRSAPTLSKTIRFYVHGSLILPTAGDAGDAKLGFGVGTYLFESVAFAWAIDTDGHHYSMLGLNIPEAVKFFK